MESLGIEVATVLGTPGGQVEQHVIGLVAVVDVERVVVAIDEFQALGDIVEPHAAILVLDVALGVVAVKQQAPVALTDVDVDGRGLVRRA